MDLEIPVGDEQDNEVPRKLIKLSEKELIVAKLYFNGNVRESLSYLTFYKVDNKKLHGCNYFHAKVYLSQDNEEDVFIVCNSQNEVDKIIYFVGGENEMDLVAMFGNMRIFSNKSLYERFSRKIGDSQEYVLEEENEDTI